jgi:hypothetical protein
LKITHSFKFLALLLVLICSSHVCASGQDSYINGRWNIKAGYSLYSQGSWTNNVENMTGHYRLETNYGFFDVIESGIYFGYSNHFNHFSRNNDPTWFYGMNLNLHLMPFFLELNNPLFEVYLAGKFGGRYYIKNHTEYSIGGGLSFYLFRNVGLYTEYLYGNHGAYVFFKDHMKLRYGLTVRF